jgi:hypothetical protein
MIVFWIVWFKVLKYTVTLYLYWRARRQMEFFLVPDIEMRSNYQFLKINCTIRSILPEHEVSLLYLVSSIRNIKYFNERQLYFTF